MDQTKVFNRLKEISFFLPLTGLLLLGILKYSDGPLLDFANYYFGGSFQLKGDLQGWLYNPTTFNNAIESEGFLNIFSSFSPNPPSLAFLFQVFAFLDPYVSKLLFNIVGSVFFVGFCYRWFKYFSLDIRIVLVIPVLFYKPLLANLYQGQVYLILLVFLMEGFIALRKNQYFLFSILWAFPVFLKLFPIILGLYLLFTRQLKAAVWFASVLLFSFGILVWVQGRGIWSTFLLEILPQVSKGEVMDSYALSFQSWHVLFSYLFLEDAISNPFPLINSAFLFSLSLVLVKALFIGQSAALAEKNRNGYKTFAVFVIASLLLSPVGSMYSLILLVGLVICFFAENPLPKVLISNQAFQLVFFCILVFVICNLQIHTYGNISIPFRFSRLLFVTVLWLLLFKKSEFQWKYSLIAFVIFSAPVIKLFAFPSRKDLSSYFPIQQNRGIVSNFRFENQFFKFWYRDEKGFHKKEVYFPIESLDNQSVYIKDNVLFHGNNLILDSPDQKEKPVLINGKTIVYLSSKHRGPGLFAFRQINLNEAN